LLNSGSGAARLAAWRTVAFFAKSVVERGRAGNADDEKNVHACGVPSDLLKSRSLVPVKVSLPSQLNGKQKASVD
jgi:hypothetical protein